MVVHPVPLPVPLLLILVSLPPLVPKVCVGNTTTLQGMLKVNGFLLLLVANPEERETGAVAFRVEAEEDRV